MQDVVMIMTIDSFGRGVKEGSAQLCSRSFFFLFAITGNPELCIRDTARPVTQASAGSPRISDCGAKVRVPQFLHTSFLHLRDPLTAQAAFVASSEEQGKRDYVPTRWKNFS